MLDGYSTDGRTQGCNSMLQEWDYFVIKSLTFQTNKMTINDANGYGIEVSFDIGNEAFISKSRNLSF
jgi:hypothetical protein